MVSKCFRRALACVSMLAIGTVATPASAQQIHRIVAFGDSYADTGNAFALGYANPQALAIYPTGRFSSGSNYIDTLASILQVPVQDFAIGGAFGGTNNGTFASIPSMRRALLRCAARACNMRSTSFSTSEPSRPSSPTPRRR